MFIPGTLDLIHTGEFLFIHEYFVYQVWHWFFPLPVNDISSLDAVNHSLLSVKICYHVSLSKHVEYLSYVVINKKVYNIMKINEMWLNIWIKLMMMLISWWTIIVRVSYTTYILLNGYKLLETSKIQNVVIWYFKWNW